jgi:septation ring formation regulator EzrA
MDHSIITEVVVVLLSVLGTVCGWFLRSLWDIVHNLKEEVGKLEVHLAEQYVPYSRLQDALKPIMDALSEIKETLRTKADKQ